MKGYDLTRARLSSEQLNTVLNYLPRHTRAWTLFKFLASNKPSTAKAIEEQINVKNVSRCCLIELNPKIQRFGLVAANELPELPHVDNEGRRTGQADWALYHLDSEMLEEVCHAY